MSISLTRKNAAVALAVWSIVQAGACARVARQGIIAYMAVTTTSKDVDVQLNRSFVERFKNKVSIDVMLTIDRVSPRANPPSIDGDLHLAGRAPLIGLPVVAEITNAAAHKDAMATAHRAGGSNRPIDVTGVWRIWPEHAKGGTEVQGDSLDPAHTADPSHVFEIHPITRLDGIDLLHAFVPVEGFKPGNARRTFGIYQSASCALTVRGDTISIVTQPGLYNDVEFVMELGAEPQRSVGDGRFVTASALDKKGERLVDGLRMVFAKGTAPELAVRVLKPGDRLHVYGIPRLNLDEISRRASRAAARTAVTGPLPYEIIILGVYPK